MCMGRTWAGHVRFLEEKKICKLKCSLTIDEKSLTQIKSLTATQTINT